MKCRRVIKADRTAHFKIHSWRVLSVYARRKRRLLRMRQLNAAYRSLRALLINTYFD